jgi:outer membrane receptor protein involved in Fe transport
MTRSRLDTIGPRRPNNTGHSGGARRRLLRRLPLASAISAILAGGAPLAHAAGASEAESGALEEIVVTAQKKVENLQDVPISIQALGTEKLEELNIVNIDDYVKYLSGVTTVKSLGQGGNGIGTTHVYMRGVVSGQDGNHSASQPSVGTYFDEQPVTTIDGSIDIHVYDIARVEVLEGPQGTLYGASSEAGTIRIITNKPDPDKFSAAYDLGGNSIDRGGYGSTIEGYVNFPLTPVAAIRIVGWDEHDGGFINNVAGTNTTAGIIDGTRTFSFTNAGQTFSQTLSNASSVSNDYNTSETKGGRAALKLDIGDNWTVTPTFMGQSIAAKGFFGYDPAVGDLDVTHFGPENTQDSFTQTALTVEGKFSDFDLVYAGGWLVRNTHSIADYSDYSYFYDKYFGSGNFWRNSAGQPIEPQELVITTGHYTKWSNELRLNTPQQYPVKGTVGIFAQRQVHEIWEDYVMPGLGGNPYTYNPQGVSQSLAIPGLDNNTLWLTDEERVDRDKAAFGQATWDIDQAWSVTGGLRFYKYDNSLQGFYGYSGNYDTLTGFYPGQNICGPPGGPTNPNYAPFHFAPCTDLNQTVSDSGHTERLTINYKFDPDRMVYATYSTGFRPGGVNRVYDTAIKAIFPPYQADQLKNYELGWKTQWDGHRLRWNGAIFLENWDNFQFLYLGPNSVTVVQNAASAQIKGLETDVEWAAGGGLLLSGGLTYLHAVTTANYCGPQATIPGTTQLSTNCPNQINSYPIGNGPVGPEAPAGTRLPVAPKLKMNLVARETFPINDWEGFFQAAGMYQTSTTPLLRLIDQESVGDMPGYGLIDLSGGATRNGLSVQAYMTNALDRRAELTRFVECATTTCGNQPYIIPTQPRTVGIKFGQKF